MDLCLSVLVAMGLLWLVAQRLPLDSDDAGMPIMGIVGLVVFYLAWARDHILPSVGRRVFALHLARVGGGRAGTLMRPITVYDVKSMQDEYGRIVAAVSLVLTASLISMMLGADGLGSTSVFKAAEQFASRTEPFAGQFGGSPTLDRLPRGLLVGEERAYVHVGATWGERRRGLDFFLARARKRDPWIVEEVRLAELRVHGNYGLKVADAEVPLPPTP